MRWALLLIILGWGMGVAADMTRGEKIPSEKTIKETQTLLGELLVKETADYAAKKITEEGMGDKYMSLQSYAETPDAAYCIYTMALKHYEASHTAVSKAAKCVEMLNKRFKGYDGASELLNTMTTMMSNAPKDQAENVMTQCFQIYEGLKDPETQKKMESLFAKLSRNYSGTKAWGKFELRKKAVEAAQKDQAELLALKASLEKNPDDPAKNKQYAEILLVKEEDWVNAIPHLMKAGDAELNKILKLEAEGEITEENAMSVGEAYWKYSEKQSPALSKIFKKHAGEIYELVYDNSAGLKRALLDRRFAEIDKLFPPATASKQGATPTTSTTTAPTPTQKPLTFVTNPAVNAPPSSIFACIDAKSETQVRQFLGAKPGSLNDKTADGKTVLQYAIAQKNCEMITLLSSYIKLDITADVHKFILFDAVDVADLPTVKTVIGIGALINVQTETGESPLHRAAVAGHLDIVKYCISCGADPFLKNKGGRTPYDLAKAPKVKKYLRDVAKEGTLLPKRVLELLAAAVKANDLPAQHALCFSRVPATLSPPSAASAAEYASLKCRNVKYRGDIALVEFSIKNSSSSSSRILKFKKHDGIWKFLSLDYE